MISLKTTAHKVDNQFIALHKYNMEPETPWKGMMAIWYMTPNDEGEKSIGDAAEV